MKGKDKHGLTQSRITNAKSYAQNFLEAIHKIELMYQLSAEGLVDEEFAENYISNNIKEFDQCWEELKGYVKQRNKVN